MAAEAHIFPEQKLLISRFSGVLTNELFKGYYDDLLSLPGATIDFSELVDFRQITEVAIDDNTLAWVALQVDQAFKSAVIKPKCAVLAPHDLGFGLARMYEGGMSPNNVELGVFRDVAEALGWLKIDRPDFETALDQLDQSSPSLVLRRPADPGPDSAR